MQVAAELAFDNDFDVDPPAAGYSAENHAAWVAWERRMSAEYRRWQEQVNEFDATHETPSMAALLADKEKMADQPFDPYAEIEAGTL